MNISESGAPKAFWMYSVWPGKPKPSSDMAFLLIGPVTRTSIRPALSSATAFSSEAMAPLAEAAVAWPGSA